MRKTIDTQRAEMMRLKGIPWREIGIILAREDERETPYRDESVRKAVTRARQQHGDTT